MTQEKGRIIFLNGVTSSGQTSIVEALQERDEIKPHYQQLLEILQDNPLDIVEVYCPLDICRQRMCGNDCQRAIREVK